MGNEAHNRIVMRQQIIILIFTLTPLIGNSQNDTITNCTTPPISITQLTRGVPFKPNGYNKIYNDNDEIWQDGEYKNGKLWNGKVYIYDSDGILLRILIYKEGIYEADGQR